MYANATWIAQVDVYTNHLASNDTKISAFKNTIANLQGKAKNLKGKNQAASKKTLIQTTDRKVYTHPMCWSAK